MNNIKIYYAHHLWKYNTPIEQYELALIKTKFPNAIIINPNGHIKQDNSEEDIMNECLESVKKCNTLVFSSMSGVVGKGVVDEVNCAKENGKDIYYLNENELRLCEGYRFDIIKKSHSNRLYALVKII